MAKVAIVTGASTGLGRSLSLQLAREGYAVGMLARNGQLLAEVQAAIAAAGGTAAFAVCDIKDGPAVKASLDSLQATLGPVDLLIANAGIGDECPLENLTAERARHVIETNFVGAVQTIAEAIPSMIRRRTGQIVAISSLASYMPATRSFTYAASKAGLNAFLEGLRLEARRWNIRVTTVCPGYIRTPLTAENDYYMPLMMEPDRAASLILRRARLNHQVINFPAPLFFLVKCINALPRWLKRILMK